MGLTLPRGPAAEGNLIISFVCMFFLPLGAQTGAQEGPPGGKGAPIHKFISSIILSKHMKMFCLKFNQNRTINKEFDF